MKNNLLKIGILLTPVLFFIFNFSLVSAGSLNSQTKGGQQQQQIPAQKLKQETKKEEIKNQQEERVRTRLRSRSKEIISKRIASMNAFRTRLEQMNLISDTYKNRIKKNLDEAISALNNLGEKIDKENDPSKLKELHSKIFWDSRIYLVEIPKNRGLAVASMAQTLNGKIKTSLKKVDEAIASAEKNGKNVDKIKTELASLELKLDESFTKINKAIEEFEAMKATRDTSDAKSHLEKGKAILKEVKGEMLEIKNALHQLLPELKTILNS